MRYSHTVQTRGCLGLCERRDYYRVWILHPTVEQSCSCESYNIDMFTQSEHSWASSSWKRQQIKVLLRLIITVFSFHTSVSEKKNKEVLSHESFKRRMCRLKGSGSQNVVNVSVKCYSPSAVSISNQDSRRSLKSMHFTENTSDPCGSLYASMTVLLFSCPQHRIAVWHSEWAELPVTSKTLKDKDSVL